METKILIHLATGFEETEAITVIDVLRRANLDIKTVSVTGNLKVTGAHNIPVVADLLFEEADYLNAAMIILPGGMPGTSNLMMHKGLTEELIKFNSGGKKIAAICAAPMILGNMGILQGKNAVCYPGFESKLTGATVLKVPVVTDGNIVTSRGPGTAIDFALEIVGLLKNKSLAAEIKSSLVMA
jgi:4-methyl-5(b-hydroxyethyl)-thiazole monophosphate biosynthesis